MRILQTGDSCRGISHADMVNKAIGTNYHNLLKAGIDLSDFSAPGVIAWFVYMNATVHGYDYSDDKNKYLWRNLLTGVEPAVPMFFDTTNITKAGNDIFEEYVGGNTEYLQQKIAREGYKPYRLCFQLDPFDDNSRYRCKFVGAFILSEFENTALTSRKYTKISDSFNLGDKGECGDILGNKEFFKSRMSIYNMNIDVIDLPEPTLVFLKKKGITKVCDLLDTSFIDNDPLSPLSVIIRNALYNIFGNKCTKN